MTDSPAQVIQMLLTKPTDLEHVRSLTTPDLTYVSLSEHNPELQRYLPWTGTNRGPESIVTAFEGIGRTWQTNAFEVREVIQQNDNVAMFGSFTYSRPRYWQGDHVSVLPLSQSQERKGFLYPVP